MRKTLGVITGSLSTLLFAAQAFAVEGESLGDPCTNSGQFAVLCQLTANKFGNIIGAFLNLVFVIAIVAALFYLIYGGIKWVLSEGDKSSVEAARNHIVASLVGLIVIFLAYFIINLLIGFFLPGQSISTLKLPKLQ